jgi:hypothetical protein
MTPGRQAALLAALTKKMRGEGSWAGETHIQKATYFLQTLLDVPTGFRFSLYKYGPFSFDLRDKLDEMRSDQQLQLKPQPAPYGPKLVPADGAEQLYRRFPKTLHRYDKQLQFVAERLGGLGVGSLERLATALMVLDEAPEISLDEQADRVRQYKPHVTLEAARGALERVEEMRGEWDELQAA